jgi:hypothetical protein
MPSKRAIASVLGAAAVLGAATVALPATAGHGPSVTFSIPHGPGVASVSGGDTGFPVAYSSAHLPSGSVLILEAYLGPKGGWRRVELLPGSRGKAVGPPAAEGKRAYRVVALARGKVVAVSAPQTLYVVGSTPYHYICKNPHIAHLGCVTRTTWEHIDQTVFYYEAIRVAPGYPTYSQIVVAQHSTCVSADLTFSGGTANPRYTVFIRVTQPGRPPQVASTSSFTVGKFHAHLDGGPWKVEISTLPATNPVIVNGEFGCYTLVGT